jgi:hypothetical protein
MDDIRNLIGAHQAPCVSIYMPTHRAGKEIEQDPIRFKNLVRRAEEELIRSGMRSSEAKELLSPAEPLLEDGAFWRHQSDGLAVFICKDNFRHYRVPFSFPEIAVTGERFHIKPLVPLITNDGRFYVVAISKDGVRVLQGTRDSVAELDLENIPQGIADALRFDVPEKQLQFHTEGPRHGGGTAGANRDAVFFGSGDADLDVKNELLRYFQQVDKGLHELLKDEQAPVVLAGVDYMFPIFREASKYPHVMDKGISGNPDQQSAADLHRKAWDIVGPRFKETQRKAAERLEGMLGSKDGHASNSFEVVVPAAIHGRVDTLFVPYNVRQWGTFDSEKGEVELHEERRVGDQDLLDLATAHSLATGAAVFAVQPEDVPGRGGIAASLRY